MVSLITASDVEARLATTFDTPKTVQVEAFIADASAEVLLVGDPDWDPADADNLPPAAVKSVVFQMVRRAYTNPDGYQSEDIGDYSYRRDDTVSSGGIMMTKAEYKTVRRAAKKASVATVGVRRTNAYEREYLGGVEGDELIL